MVVTRMTEPPAERDRLAHVRRVALGSRLRQLRNRQGLSQQQLADLAGVDRSFLAQVESGKHSPRVDWLYHVAAALGVHIMELFTESGRSGILRADRVG
jgi:transcriptional regulator with XRE-family HTH domain